MNSRLTQLRLQRLWKLSAGYARYFDREFSPADPDLLTRKIPPHRREEFNRKLARSNRVTALYFGHEDMLHDV